MSLLDEVIRLDESDPDAAKDLCDLLHGLLEKTLELRRLAHLLLAENPDEAPEEFVDEADDMEALRTARKKLNDIGVYRSKMGRHEGMRQLTDMYAQLGMLLREPTKVLDRECIGTVKFDRPISYRRDLCMTGVTAVRTTEENNRNIRVIDGLQVAFDLPKEIPGSEPLLQRGWVGSREELEGQYRSAKDGGSEDFVQPHVLGRMWNGVEFHDFATEKAGDWCRDTYTLTFVSLGKTSPEFFGRERISLRNFASLEDDMKYKKHGVGRVLLQHLHGATNISMDGSVVAQ